MSPDLTNPSGRLWQKRAFILIFGLFIWRLIFILTVPLDLAGDESYYWDWSRQLALGYFSKPPMIAWINYLSSALLPHSVFAVRMPAALFSLGSMWALFALAKRMFSARTAFWSVAAFAASPGSAALAYVMTIDAPLVCAWLLAIYCLWRALYDETANNRWWLAVGLAGAFGILSKQMMLIFPVLVMVFLLTDKAGRKTLKTPQPYLTALLSFAGLLPPIWWNMQNNWVTIKHTGHHFEANREGGLFFLHTLGDFVGGQLMLISPIICILFVALTVLLISRFRAQEARVRYLLLFSIPCLIMIFFLSMRQRINANWTAIFYPTGTILLAAWGCGELDCSPRFDRLRRFFRPGIWLGVLFAVLVYSLPYYINGASFGGSKNDPLKRIKGWQQLAVQVEEYRSQLTPAAKEKTFLLAADREVVSQLAFYLPDTPRVYKWTSWPGVIDSQYDIWQKPDSRLGDDAIFILKEEIAVPEELRNSFVSMRKVAELDISLGKGGSRNFVLYLGRNLKNWPR